MGRPPLALGTAGAIRYYETATGYRARVLVRDHDGHVRAPERRAPSKTAAERALEPALRDHAPAQAHGEITADSRVTDLAEAWHAGLAALSPSRCRPTAIGWTASSSPASAPSASANSASAPARHRRPTQARHVLSLQAVGVLRLLHESLSGELRALVEPLIQPQKVGRCRAHA
ncbi:hypothetical protein ACI782_23980 [Geodermatophilus sp. SYSU D00703]